MPLTLASDNLVVFAISGGLVIAMLGMLTSFIYKIYRTRAVEQTRREIAAYVAEGSISPEQGERLMAAGATHSAECH